MNLASGTAAIFIVLLGSVPSAGQADKPPYLSPVLAVNIN